MNLLRISGPVRRAFGEANASALDAGIGLPPDAQCWVCGDALNLLAARPGEISLSVVEVNHTPSGGAVAITLFAHREHSGSRVVPFEEFEATASDKPSPVTRHEALIVDGNQIA